MGDLESTRATGSHPFVYVSPFEELQSRAGEVLRDAQQFQAVVERLPDESAHEVDAAVDSYRHRTTKVLANTKQQAIRRAENWAKQHRDDLAETQRRERIEQERRAWIEQERQARIEQERQARIEALIKQERRAREKTWWFLPPWVAAGAGVLAATVLLLAGTPRSAPFLVLGAGITAGLAWFLFYGWIQYGRELGESAMSFAFNRIYPYDRWLRQEEGRSSRFGVILLVPFVIGAGVGLFMAVYRQLAGSPGPSPIVVFIFFLAVGGIWTFIFIMRSDPEDRSGQWKKDFALSLASVLVLILIVAVIWLSLAVYSSIDGFVHG